MLSVQPSFLAIVASGSQQVQQQGSVQVTSTVVSSGQPGNNGQQMAGGQPDGGGSAGSSGNGCGVGSQPQVAN